MHIVITGAAGGIGRALAQQLATPENRLTLVDRDGDGLAALTASLATSAFSTVADLADLDRVCECIDHAEERHGPVDVLISNAAVGYIDAAWEVGAERAERLFRVNLLAPLRLIDRVLPSMRERGTGTIVCISSVTGIIPAPFQAHYSASKAALAGYAEALRGELLGSGVNVLTVYPGPIATAMDERVKTRLADSPRLASMKVGTPEGLAQSVADSISSGAPRLVYPRRYAITRWFYALSYWATVNFPIPLRGPS